jgi:Got1/Sft2-like family
MVLEDNQKIGIGLICLGLGFVTLGVILLFDASLIAIGNTLFLAGLCFAIGIKRTITLFTRYEKSTANYYNIFISVLNRNGKFVVIFRIFDQEG